MIDFPANSSHSSLGSKIEHSAGEHRLSGGLNGEVLEAFERAGKLQELKDLLQYWEDYRIDVRIAQDTDDVSDETRKRSLSSIAKREADAIRGLVETIADPESRALIIRKFQAIDAARLDLHRGRLQEIERKVELAQNMGFLSCVGVVLRAAAVGGVAYFLPLPAAAILLGAIALAYEIRSKKLARSWKLCALEISRIETKENLHEEEARLREQSLCGFQPRAQ